MTRVRLIAFEAIVLFTQFLNAKGLLRVGRNSSICWNNFSFLLDENGERLSKKLFNSVLEVQFSTVLLVILEDLSM